MLNITLNATVVEQSPDSALDLFLSRNIVYLETTLYILYSLIFIFGVVGNSIVIYVLVSSLCINRNMQVFNEQSTINRNNHANKANIALQPLAVTHGFNSSFKSLLKKRTSNPNVDTLNLNKEERIALNYNQRLKKVQIDLSN